MERSFFMKKTENSRFAMVAWVIMMVAYVVALSQTGGQISIPFAACGAIGAVGLAQSWSDWLNERKHKT